VLVLHGQYLVVTQARYVRVGVQDALPDALAGDDEFFYALIARR
jgi:hypothetical protein